MRTFSPRPVFTLSIFFSATHNATKTPHFAAFTTHATSRHHLQRGHEEESRGVRVSVWWDFENCNVPVNANAFRVAQCITNAIRANGIKGPIEITAFGDVMQVSRTNQEALSATGINLTHVPSGGKNSADRSLLVDLMHWVSKNPPPAHLFLISGDRDFAGILHRLRMSNYNILLASPDTAPNVLCSAATIMWHWSSLLKGENLNGKLFNQPPDGPYNSWYGYYKAPVEDPFAVAEQSSCPSADEPSLLASESKLRPIPKSVKRHVLQILRSYPDGLSVIQLRSELSKSVDLEKDFYGYKKFTRFLLSMPQLKLNGDGGTLLVQCVNTSSPDELAPATCEEPGRDNVQPIKKSSSENVTEKSAVAPVPDLKAKAELSNLQEAPKEKSMEAHAAYVQDLKKEENRKIPLPVENVQEIQEKERKLKLMNQTRKDEVAPPVVDKNENKMLVSDDHSTAFGFGIFRKIWMKLFGSGDSKLNLASTSGKDSVTQQSLKSCQSSEPVHAALFSPSSHEALVDGKTAQSGDPASDISSQASSFSNRSSSWFKFWRYPKLEDKVVKNGETADCLNVSTKQVDENNVEKSCKAAHVEVKSKQVMIFAKESFWKEIESFIDTYQGSALFSRSKTREQVAQNLQKLGPPVLRSLSESDLLQLVDLLIYDKKWVEVRDSQRHPFRLTRPEGKCPENSSNGLSRIFSAVKGPENNQNHPQAGVLHRGSSNKPRGELLTDCEKLVGQIVKEYPEGFNIGGFRKLFSEKLGYALDLKKLGHDKLVNFLKTVPGAMVESNLILPAGAIKKHDLQNTGHPIQESEVDSVVNLQGDSSIIAKEDDESDSWDELGPVETSGSEKDEIDTSATWKNRKATEQQRLPHYEPLREDDFSDSEEDTSSSESECKAKVTDESALLDILDSWHSQKEGTSVESGSEISSTPGTRTKSEREVVKNSRKQKASKSYSFVKEQAAVGPKDKLIDGILGNLKKSGGSSADSQILS